VRKVAARPRRALRDENRRARGDPLRRRLREPDTHATDLWRFVSASGHRSRALQVLGRARPVRSNPLAQGQSASRVRFRDAGQPKPEAPRSSIPHSRCRESLPAPRPSAGNDWQNGPCHPSVTARPRRGFAQPHPGSTRLRTPRGGSGRVLDPSIESVQPTCQRSAPGFRVGCRQR
jgi:hypothetical protein